MRCWLEWVSRWFLPLPPESPPSVDVNLSYLAFIGPFPVDLNPVLYPPLSLAMAISAVPKITPCVCVQAKSYIGADGDGGASHSSGNTLDKSCKRRSFFGNYINSDFFSSNPFI
ncbi:hypothetical protein GmHk_17G050104 [Glycine max]|nr:hypothetical protein GmHk_17G050104 [Glycine max]